MPKKNAFPLLPGVPAVDDVDLSNLTRYINHPVYSLIYRKRFEMVRDLCPERAGNILEIGYGLGYMAYGLCGRCESYTGIDIHAFSGQVEDNLRKYSANNVRLMRSDARTLEGIEDGSMDLVVSVSCLEHIREALDVQKAIFRALKPGGIAAYGMPEKNLLTKGLFRILGYDDEEIHPTSPQMVARAAREAGLEMVRESILPPFGRSLFGMYWAGAFRRPA